MTVITKSNLLPPLRETVQQWMEASTQNQVLNLRSFDTKSNGAASIQFKGNSAKLGEAEYVNDSNPVLCQRSSSDVGNSGSASIEFTNNFARHGPVLFGGLLDRLTVSQYANVNTVKNYRNTLTDGVQSFSDITNINDSRLTLTLDCHLLSY